MLPGREVGLYHPRASMAISDRVVADFPSRKDYGKPLNLLDGSGKLNPGKRGLFYIFAFNDGDGPRRACPCEPSLPPAVQPSQRSDYFLPSKASPDLRSNGNCSIPMFLALLPWQQVLGVPRCHPGPTTSFFAGRKFMVRCAVVFAVDRTEKLTVPCLAPISQSSQL